MKRGSVRGIGGKGGRERERGEGCREETRRERGDGEGGGPAVLLHHSALAGVKEE